MSVITGKKLKRYLVKYLNLLLIFFQIDIMSEMAYRPSFFFMIAGKLIRLALLLLFFNTIFLHVKSIGGWNYDQIMLLFATFALMDFAMSVLFHRTLSYLFPNSIRNGSFDFKLVKPVNTLFYTSFQIIDLIDMVCSLPMVLFLFYTLYRLRDIWTLSSFILYLAMVSNGLIFIYGVVLGLSSTAFWTVQSSGISRVFDSFMKLGRYPTEIYSRWLEKFLYYILPISLIAVVPSRSLLGILSTGKVLFASIVSWLFLLLGISIWKKGLKIYTSTSS